ncbi:Bacteroides conjugative transposon TraJ protein [Chlamydia trachomatis]|nr:Bacteroides conjugative transposon TraJ protein [Chlamydia trachomatis]
MADQNVIDKSIISITETINEVFDKMMDSADLLIGLSTVIAGIGCIIYLASVLLPMIERSERIEIYPLLKPIFVALVIANFTTLTKAGSEISTGVGSAIGKMVATQDTNSYFKIFMSKVDEMTGRSNSDTPDAPPPSEDADGSGSTTQTEKEEDGFWTWLLWQFVYGILIPGLAWLAMFLGQLIYLGLLIFSKFYLVVLAIVGPLSFGLSQFKMFAGSATQWLARFLSVALWPGLANLVKAIINEIVMAIAQNMQPTFSAVIVSILLLIFSATLYLQVPTLASFIIQSGGVGNSTGTAKNILKKLI